VNWTPIRRPQEGPSPLEAPLAADAPALPGLEQINPFGLCPGGDARDQVAAHIGYSASSSRGFVTERDT